MTKRKLNTRRELTLKLTRVRVSSEGKSDTLVRTDDGDRGECRSMKQHCGAPSKQREDDQPKSEPSWGESPHGSRCESRGSSTDEFDSDEFSEPDPDPSDEWLPFGPDRSDRASSPDDPEIHAGVSASIIDLCGQAPGWQEADWQPNQIPFTATPGPRGAAAKLDSSLPADFLELFLTDKLLQHIVDQTNKHARQYFQAHPGCLPCDRENAWRPVSVPELKTFFGLSFITCYIKKPNIDLYWSVDEDATPYFSRTMSRNRFKIIWKFLHYNDDASQDATDKMYEVRPVLDHIVEKFKELYQPGQNICIAEGMMQWRERLALKVYNPQKNVNSGMKSYILSDSATGYCFNMQPYVGKASPLPDVVFSLLDRLPGHGYTLYMDNFYNSVALCERLLGAQTNVCATLMMNRGEPKIITDLTNLKAGTKVVRHNEKVMVVAWQDKRLVKMVTTCHQDSMLRADTWQKGHKSKVPQFKPECVVEHNAFMNGVERMDHNISYYPFIRRTLGWSKQFVAYLFQLCMFNAYVIYRARNPGKCKTLMDFMCSVVKSWTAKRHVLKEEEEEVAVGEQVKEEVVAVWEQLKEEEVGVEVRARSVSSKRRVCQPTPRAPYNTDPASRLDGLLAKHKLNILIPLGKKSQSLRKCRVCARKGLRRETKMCCTSCCVPLHPGECFRLYHTKQNYAEG